MVFTDAIGITCTSKDPELQEQENATVTIDCSRQFLEPKLFNAHSLANHEVSNKETAMKLNQLYRWLLVSVIGLSPLLVSLPASARSVKITLTITELLKRDNVDGTHPSDFYASAKLGQRDSETKGYVANADHIFPNWTFEQDADADAIVPILITIRDYDPAVRDVLCDVSPVYGKKALQLYYHVATGQISGDVEGADNQILSAQGMGDDHRVLIWFRVTQSEAPPPPAVGIYIDSITPEYVRPGDMLVINGINFGLLFDGSDSQPRAKQVMILPVPERGSVMNPTPIPLEIWSWSRQSIQARIPYNVRPGGYRLGIYSSTFADAHNTSKSVSNMVTLNVLGF
jgi:hypothetical protein